MRKITLLILVSISLSSWGQTIVVKPTDSLIVITPATYTIIPKAAVVTNPRNQPPTCFAGNTQTITLPVNSVTLSGTATDKDGKIVSTAWVKTTTLSGTIVSPNSLSTSVTGLAQGTHIFRLTVTDDSAATATSTVNVTVNPAVVPDTGTIKMEGFGANAIGGSQSPTVYHVTNTSSSGAGSLASGIGSNKTIVFDISGTIVGRFDLAKISYLTIDGSDQDITINNNNNGDGISFNGANTHHCILKNIRVINAGNDGINVIDGSHDIFITNCTSYNNGDGNIDVAADNAGQTKNVTVQYCLMWDNNGSGKMLVTGQNVSVHHNLYMSTSASGEGSERNPFVHANYSPVGSPNCDFRNNVVYNWGRYGTGFGYKSTVNIVNNYYASNKGGAINPAADPSGNTASYYVAGNTQSGGANINLNGGNHAEYNIPAQAQITMQEAKAAAALVLKYAGTSNKTVKEQAFINGIKVQ